MALKILVIDADLTVQRALENALAQAGYDTVPATVAGSAVALFHSQQPALVLLATQLPDGDGFAVLASLRAAEPPSTHTPIILLLGEQQADQRVEALRSGADDYLIKPFHPAEVLARMRSLLAHLTGTTALIGPAPKREPARVVAFYGAKGGVGTTTIAINTAIALHRELGRKVCLIDANFQFGDHRVFLDLGLDCKSIVELASAPAMDYEFIRQILVRHESGIDLLLAPPSPEMAELVSQDHVPAILDSLSSEYDYLLLDLDKRLDEVTLRLLDVAQTILVVMTADLPCLKNVRLVLETIGHLGYRDEKVRLVLNRSNAFTGINVRNAESALKRRIDYQVVNEYRSAIGALNSGEPFMYAKPDSVLGRNLLDFVRGLDSEGAERAAAGAKAAR